MTSSISRGQTMTSGSDRRLVVKIGSSTLTRTDSSLDHGYLESVADQIALLKQQGWEVVVVTSGAIACGLEALGIEVRPKDMPSLQAAASVGQSALSKAYADAFARHGLTTSLVLLTRRDTADRSAYLHARDTLGQLLAYGVVPIVNENDTVSVEQIRFGDNDTLAALVACLVDASLLLILSDIDGLYDKNPALHEDARIIDVVERIDRGILSISGGSGSSAGSGGMLTKVLAARIMMAAGTPTRVVDGRRANIIVDALGADAPGTLFAPLARRHEITPRKLWLALGDSAKGRILVDAGAARALREQGSSLLSVGIVGVEGRFDADDVVDIVDPQGDVMGRGKASVPSDLISLACGLSREALAANRLVCDLASQPVVHRDDLMVFE